MELMTWKKQPSDMLITNGDPTPWLGAVVKAERELAQQRLCAGILVQSGQGLSQVEMHARLRRLALAWS